MIATIDVNEILNLITKIWITFFKSFQNIFVTAREPGQFPEIICSSDVSELELNENKFNTLLTTLQKNFL